MSNINEPATPRKSKKEIKLYTYIDSDLDTKLKDFMEDYGIKNQASLLRSCLNNFIDYVNIIYNKNSINEPKKYVANEIDEYIRKAIEEYETSYSLYEEIKQRISPLKVSLLMLNNYTEELDKLLEGIDNARGALDELENFVKHRFEEPNLKRYVKKIDVLYIEDNELERKTVDAYFKRKGIDIKSIETSDEGLYLLKTLTPKAILLDINLRTSNIKGDELCRIIKSNEQYCSIPIILITALISENEKREMLNSTGADGIIIKPIDKLKDLDIILDYLYLK